MIHRVAAWLAYRVIIARPLADVLHRRFRMSKYHARKSSPQSRDQRGNSSPYSFICPSGGTRIVRAKAAPAGAYRKIINKEKQACLRIALRRRHVRECARKVRMNRHDGCQRGRLVFGVDVSSFARGIACLQARKKCDQTHLRFSPFPTAKTCRRFIFFTAHGKRRYWSCSSSVCRAAALLHYCITALLH